VKRAVSTWIKRALLLVLASASAHAKEARVIQLQHRFAADVIPVIRPLLGPDDVVTGMDSRLIVRTSDARLREIEKLLAQIDTVQRQYRISVRQLGGSDTAHTQAGISGEIGGGDVRIRLPRTSSNGTVIYKKGVRIEAEQTRTRADTDTTQFITVLDGTHAFIRVGQSVAQVQRLLAVSGNQLVLSQGVSYRDIATGFDVEPRAHGETVELRITPQLARLQELTTGLVDFQRYATTVTARPGEWIDLGGLSGNGSDVRRAILSGASDEHSERHTVMIKVD
jgi:type II secretory pathway component GspD/PulD (secretin)